MDLWSLTDLCTPWCVHVAVTLRVADHIAAGKSEITGLATACRADADSLHRLLRHLAAKGVFDEPFPGHFALNDLSRELLSDGAHSGLDLDAIGGRMAYAWGTLLSAVRTGRPAYHEHFGRPFWDDLDAHPTIAASFDALMGPAGHGDRDPNILPNPADWDSIRTVVDVGGGTGALLAAILRAHPAIHGTLLDLPRPIARAPELLHAAGVADRVTLVAQSFFDPLPPGRDLYILSKVLCDWPDREATAILRHCAEAAGPGGRVVILTGEPSPALLMMVLVGGKDRSRDEFLPLLLAAGLEVESSTTRLLACRYCPIAGA